MLPNLTIIISVYCCVRLVEMLGSNAPKWKALWALVCVTAIAVIGFFCFDTVRRGNPDPRVGDFRGSAALGGEASALETLQTLNKDLDRRLEEARSRP